MYRRIMLVLFVLILALPLPLAAQAADRAPRTNGELLFAADFNAPGELEAAFGSEWMTLEAAGGVATISSQAPDVVVTALVPGRTFGDFVAEADLLPGVQPAGAQAGILFRADGPPDIDVNAYNLYVDPSNDIVALSTLVEGGRDEDKVDLGSARLSDLGFDPAANIRLRLEAVGNALAVFANGKFAFVAESSFVPAGGFGLTLGAPDDLSDGATSLAKFAKLRIYAVGAEQAAAPVATPVAAPAQAYAPATSASAVAPRANGALLFDTAFNDSGDLAPAFSTSNMILDVHDGVATISSREVDRLEGALLPNRTFGDFIAEVDINLQEEYAGTNAGIFFRSSGHIRTDDEFFSLKLGPRDDELWASFYGAGDDQVTLGIVSLDGLNYMPGVMNRLRVEAAGETITVFLNGIYAMTFDGSRRASGGLGLILGTSEVHDQSQTDRADYDNLTVFALGEAAAAPAATAPTTDLPALEAEISGVFGMVSAKSLNVRSGPGATFPVVGKLTQGSMVLVDARNADCSWLQIMALEAEGWVSSQFVDLVMNACDEVPLAGSAGAAQPAAPVVPVAAATPAIGSTVNSVVTDFENFGTWTRGDEAYATFTQSAEKVAGGAYAGKLAYDFPANAPDGKNYVVFKREIPIGGAPAALTLDVHGDGSGSLLNVWVTDAGGQAWQFAFGPVTHTGWKTLHAPLDTTAKWPVGIVAGSQSDKKLDYPIKLRALVLDYPTDDAEAGTIYMDNLTAVAK